MQSYWYAYHLFIMRYSYAGRPFAVALFVWLSPWIKPWAIWDLVHILWISFSKILFLTLAQVCVSFHISFKYCPTSWGEALTYLTVTRTLPFKLLVILPSFSAKTVARVKKLAKKVARHAEFWDFGARKVPLGGLISVFSLLCHDSRDGIRRRGGTARKTHGLASVQLRKYILKLSGPKKLIYNFNDLINLYIYSRFYLIGEGFCLNSPLL